MKRRFVPLGIVTALIVGLAGCASGWTPKAAVASCQAKYSGQSNIGIPTSEYDALVAIDKAAGTSFISATGVWPCRYVPSPCAFTGRAFTYANCSGGHIVDLGIRQQGISRVPPEIAQLKELVLLNLVGNRLTELPIEVSCLSHLQILYLRDNRLTDLPAEFSQLSGLTHLGLSENNLTALPPAVVEMSDLQVLFLSDNELTELPPEIEQLQSLTHLYLGGNLLTELPSEISQMPDLEYINVTGNPITEIPPEICAMPDLRIDPAGLCEDQ